MARVVARLWRFAAAALVCGGAAGPSVACAPAPRMCTAEGDCGTRAACVAGRCVLRAATPAIATARRILVAPIDEGWVRRGDAARGDVATLGRGDGAIVFLRFSVPLAPEVTVVEGFLMLERAPGLEMGAEGLSLHAAGVEGAWDGRSLSWGRQPAVVEVGAAVTTVRPGEPAIVRLDMRSIIERWRRHPRLDGGVAVVADGVARAGLPLALAPSDALADRDDPVLAPEPSRATRPPSPSDPRVATRTLSGDPRYQVSGPRLELYVR